MIQITKTDKHNRTVLFTNIPATDKNDPVELEVLINYTEQPNEGGRLYKAVCLDNRVIPAIHGAFECARQLEALAEQVKQSGGIIPPNVIKALKAVKGNDWRES